MRNDWTGFLSLGGWLVSSCARILLPSWRLLTAALVAAWLPSATRAADLATAMAPPVAPVSDGRPLTVRITWGGGQPRAWTGRIAIVNAADAAGAAEPVTWRTLSPEPDAAAFVHEQSQSLEVHQPRPIASDGVEVSVRDFRGRRLVAALRPVGASTALITIDVPLADLLGKPVSEPLDDAGNRFAAKIASGDMLRVTLGDAAGDAVAMSREAVRRPGDRVRVTVDPLLMAKADSGLPVVLTMRLKPTGEGAEIAAQEIVLTPLGADQAVAGPQPIRYAAVTFDVVLPSSEGAYEIDLEAMERSSLRWTRPLASRTVQIIAIADTVADVPTTADWKILYELDPGSPKLHERLRRLPGMGLPSMSLPSVPLPAMSLPSIPRPNLPLPKLPAVPVPSVASLSSMVPRLSGLLAVGHSRVEPHPLGPMLRLPPGDDTGAPSWEGVLVANTEPGRPHVVEIEFPSDQDAVVGVAVLEADAAGAKVLPRHAGGFEVRREPRAARLGTHRFAFWPTTRQPLLVIANAERTAALFGRVRVLAGPARLPAAEASAHGGGRRLHAYVADPTLAEFGGRDRAVRDGAGAVSDWRSHFEATQHLVQQLRARAAAGAVVTVYAGGAATWPSAALRQAPRWGSGAAADTGLDPAPKDLLELLCRSCGREGVRLRPAVVFDAPLPAVEAVLAQGGSDATGIACVGRDGRPRRTSGHGGLHYNILDPRVQAAVVEVVTEVVARTREAAAVDGLAVMLPSDGWLHMPGVAWGLDDATFGRFLTDMKLEEPAAAANRFAARAAVIEGPLRVEWLEWRAAQTTAFWTRLADVVARGSPDRPARTLAVIPTTLLSSGDCAARFHPTLAAEPRTADVFREIAFEPARFATDPRLMYGAPQVRSGGASLAVESATAAANRVLAATTSARGGAVLFGEPRLVDLAGVVPHGPFSSAIMSGPVRIHTAATFAERDRSLAEAHAAADIEVVFDAGLVRSLPAEPSASRQAVESLPVEPLELVAGVPAPLVVRSKQAGGRTWLHVINAADSSAMATVAFDRQPLGVVDAVTGTRLPLVGTTLVVPVEAWGMRGLWAEGAVQVASAKVGYEPAVREAIETRVEQLKERRKTLEMPVPIDVLDNPSFELGGDMASSGATRSSLPGWEIVEARRGTLGVVAGREPEGSLAASFTSANGLSTLRSNPFARPASGRLSIAAWLRIKEGDPQPPLRIALEGDEDGREYYRFAAIGGIAGGRPLGTQWTQFVLQVDDLPDTGLESLRVRFDLLGPGSVEIDEVRLFDLAFDESQRVQLTRMLTVLDQRLAADDVGGCLVDLAGHWPRYLEAFVPEQSVVEAAAKEAAAAKATMGRAKSGKWWK
jgi:hypothetical protein